MRTGTLDSEFTDTFTQSYYGSDALSAATHVTQLLPCRKWLNHIVKQSTLELLVSPSRG